MPELRSSEIQKLTGLTPRQIQWADERGIVKPTSKVAHGYRRYSQDQAILLYLISQLRRKGMSLQAIRKLRTRLIMHPTSTETKFVCTNGMRVVSCATSEAVINFAKDQRSSVYVIEVPLWWKS